MGHMKLKRIPKRKKIKYTFLIIIAYLIFTYTIYYSFKNMGAKTNEEFIIFLLNNGNASYKSNYKISNIINKSFKYILKIDFTKPSTLFNENIIGYNEDNDSYSNLEQLKEISYYMTDPLKTEIKDPIVYIYNSHQLENYNNNNLEIYGITPNVLMASYLLKEKLNEIGIPAIVEDTNLTEFLTLNNWDYSSSYKASRIFILDKQNTYPTLKYYIDIHRDSVGKSLTSINIKNRNYARILFVVGLEHNNYEANLNLAIKINDIFNKKYPGLSRGIYKKEGPNVNGIYNQDISPNSMLIEVGGIDNNIEEVMNTLNAISEVLKEYIDNDEKK